MSRTGGGESRFGPTTGILGHRRGGFEWPGAESARSPSALQLRVSGDALRADGPTPPLQAVSPLEQSAQRNSEIPRRSVSLSRARGPFYIRSPFGLCRDGPFPSSAGEFLAEGDCSPGGERTPGRATDRADVSVPSMGVVHQAASAFMRRSAPAAVAHSDETPMKLAESHEIP